MKIDVLQFDHIARNIFAPVYPVLAEQITNKTGIMQGTCIDIGTGGGYLGLALARITELNIILFDQSRDMLHLAAGYIIQERLESRVTTLEGDVHTIPLPDQSINLAVSRGSMFFWEDQVQAFREIYRILAPEGVAYLGGGFGNLEILHQVEEKMLKEDPEWSEKRRQRISKGSVEGYRGKLMQAGIPTFDIQQDEAGLWISMRRA